MTELLVQLKLSLNFDFGSETVLPSVQRIIVFLFKPVAASRTRIFDRYIMKSNKNKSDDKKDEKSIELARRGEAQPGQKLGREMLRMGWAKA